ncbi:MAG: pseudaminic acid synthase, partial [Deltaproteobacteria bacterium]|nr:pseudaminic acid synthase [Deltaproteobacteria bacterium]
MKKTIQIGSRLIGPGHPVYMVAEMSANHNQDFDQAVAILKEAKESGADAVKLQTYTPDTMTIDCDNAHFRLGPKNTWAGETLYQLYSRAYTPWEWQPKLKKIADEIGLDFFSTPFDFSATDFLETMDVPVYKIASFEMVDISLIEYIAKKGKPIILSTGLGKWEEIEEAVTAIRNAGNDQIVLLKCTSAYPASPENMHLKAMPLLSDKLNVLCGLSDHTLGMNAALASVTLGASVIEKHFTLSRKNGGLDAKFSLEPAEFLELVRNVRLTEAALGTAVFEPSAEEESNLVFRRSLFVVQDVKPGEYITMENVRSIRPGNGLHPRYLKQIFGKAFTKGVPRGTPLRL